MSNKNLGKMVPLTDDVHCLSLAMCKLSDPDFYEENKDEIINFRYIYLNEKGIIPTHRNNMLVCGNEGVGQEIYARYAARTMLDTEYHFLEDDLFYVVGSHGEDLLDEYDGQPILLWPLEVLVDLLSTKEGVFEFEHLFEQKPDPDGECYETSHGLVPLLNVMNVVYGVGKSRRIIDKLSELCGNRETVLSRFSLVAPIYKRAYDIMSNPISTTQTKELDNWDLNRGIEWDADKTANEYKEKIDKIEQDFIKHFRKKGKKKKK